MLRVAIVGCGKIADSHAAQIRRIRGSEIVAACDTEPLMAQQLCQRFAIARHFTDLSEMLVQAAPEIVHITTPPASHYEIARLCLQHGCHVYVEKPFSVNESEARTLIGIASENRLKITAGHDDQFSHVARRMRALVRRGFLGSGPIHMESYYCYHLSRSGYAGALLGNPRHWVRRLPGKLLHNIISHGIARIAEFLTTDSPEVIAYGFTSPALKQMGETEIVDELRVIISEEERATAYFTFSSQMRPLLHQFRIYGSKNGLILDQDQETLIRLRGERFKSYAEKFVPPVIFACQYLQNLKANLRTFFRNDFQMKSGMNFLIQSFHRSVTDGTPPPIPYREIVLTARIMDRIFEQFDRQRLQFKTTSSIVTPSSPNKNQTARGNPVFANLESDKADFWGAGIK